MAKQIITRITDDLTGEEADETLSFALDGVGYEIDLSAKNAKKLRDFMQQFLDAGTRTGRVGSSGGAQLRSYRGRSGSGHPAFRDNKQLNLDIRTWAKANSYALSERGRVPQHIVDAYHQAQSGAAQLQQETEKAAPAAGRTRRSSTRKPDATFSHAS